MNGGIVDIGTIRYPGERLAFGVLLVASFLTLAVLLVVVVVMLWAAVEAARSGRPEQLVSILFSVLFWGGLILGVPWIAKILAMASIRGHGIRVSENQYSQIHEYVRQFTTRLGLKKAPEVYVVQATLMNAFATKVIGRRYVVLYSHLVDAALESGDYDEVAVVLGHEMAHHAAGHVRWYGFLRLGFWLPFLYSFWSRRAEYTCDRAGLLLVNKLQPSLQGMVKLAVGRKLAASTSLAALRQQKAQVSREIGPTLVEIFSTHPLTIKRLTAMEDFAQGRALH